MDVKSRNVNDAFRKLVDGIQGDGYPLIRTTSRAGDVIQIGEPVTITYSQPTERVLFNQERDCNPFFHLFEAFWMLLGRNDVAPMKFYNSNIAEVASDDGYTFNGAYGYRWRRAEIPNRDNPHEDCPEEIDQLTVLKEHLKRNLGSRRAVLQMWTVENDLLKIDDVPCSQCEGTGLTPGTESCYCKYCSGTRVEKKATKDVCCNTNAYFLITKGKLDMTVCNRSNDLVWGALGANVVHFSILQEYLAAHIGVPVGVYYQFTNNLHVYTERWTPEKYLNDSTPDYYCKNGKEGIKPTPLVKSIKTFDKELPTFFNRYVGTEDCLESPIHFQEPFLEKTAKPMALAWLGHRGRSYREAEKWCGEIDSDDWRTAVTNWIRKRAAKYQRDRSGDNPYLARALQNLEEGK